MSRALATARRLTSPDRTLSSGVAASKDSRRGQEPSVPGSKDSAVDVGRADPVLQHPDGVIGSVDPGGASWDWQERLVDEVGRAAHPGWAQTARTARSSRRLQGRVRSTPPRYSPSGATAAKPTQTRTPSRPSPGSPRSPRVRQAPRCVLPLACNKRFRAAITTFAGNSRHASLWAAKIYNAARAADKDHLRAIRILARAWVGVIWP